jgi:hypothetical protein
MLESFPIVFVLFVGGALDAAPAPSTVHNATVHGGRQVAPNTVNQGQTLLATVQALAASLSEIGGYLTLLQAARPVPPDEDASEAVKARYVKELAHWQAQVESGTGTLVKLAGSLKHAQQDLQELQSSRTREVRQIARELRKAERELRRALKIVASLRKGNTTTTAPMNPPQPSGLPGA